MGTYRCEAPGYGPPVTITANTAEEAATLYRQSHPDLAHLAIMAWNLNPRSRMPMEHIDRFKTYGIPAALTAAGLVLGLALAFGAFHLFRTAHGGEIALFTVILGLLAATYYAGRNLRAHAQRESERLFEGLDAVNSWLSEFEDSVLTIQQDTAHLKRNQLAYTDRDRALVALRRLRRKLHTVARAADPDWAGIGAALDTVRGALGALPEDSPLIGSDEAEKAYQQREGASLGGEQARAYAAGLDLHRRADDRLQQAQAVPRVGPQPTNENPVQGFIDIAREQLKQAPEEFEVPDFVEVKADEPSGLALIDQLPTLVNLLDQFGVRGMAGRRCKANDGTPDEPNLKVAKVLEAEQVTSNFERSTVTTAHVEFEYSGHRRWIVVA